MKNNPKNRYVNIWTILAFLLCGLLLIVFATRDLRRLIFTGNESTFVVVALSIIIYAVPTIALIYLGGKANKYDILKKQQDAKKEKQD